MASGWNLWVWLECIGIVSGRCCKEEYRFLILLICTALVHCISFFNNLFRQTDTHTRQLM